MQNYKELNVWKKGHELVLFIYQLTATYPKTEQFMLTNQLRRAAVSIPSNVAEGCGKYSQSDFANYLQIALGSSNEVEYLTFLSHELGYVKRSSFDSVVPKINEIRAMLINLIIKVRQKK